ncbi:MAG: hypothetical protein J7501_17765 [Bdellovibrio sp.]|nr:hypothetical protein [Bdellovibrio sp.]
MTKILTLVFAMLMLNQGAFAGNSNGLRGVRNVKTVMNGVLYRGGGGGGKNPLTQDALMSLCEAGFSLAIYLYPDGFVPKTVHCTTLDGKANKLDYVQRGFRGESDRKVVMNEIYDIIENNKGPAFVHCWNGSHASGEIAAIALMQFCGLNGEQAGDYWARNIHDQSNLKNYGSIYRKHIPAFHPFSSMSISGDTKAQICR